MGKFQQSQDGVPRISIHVEYRISATTMGWAITCMLAEGYPSKGALTRRKVETWLRDTLYAEGQGMGSIFERADPERAQEVIKIMARLYPEIEPLPDNG